MIVQLWNKFFKETGLLDWSTNNNRPSVENSFCIRLR